MLAPTYTRYECQLHLTTTMSIGFWRSLTLLRACSHKLGVEEASWHNHRNMKMWNAKLVENESFILTCSAYSDDLLDGHDNLSVMFKSPPRQLSTYAHALFSHREFLLRVVTLFLRRSHIQDDVFIWSHKSKRASLWEKESNLYAYLQDETTFSDVIACSVSLVILDSYETLTYPSFFLHKEKLIKNQKSFFKREDSWIQ